jgi:hypothetical protein
MPVIDVEVVSDLQAQAGPAPAQALAASDWPVFVTVLHQRPPQGAALQQEVMALTTAIATLMQRSPERVHVQYAPAAAGRQAFGGRLVE